MELWRLDRHDGRTLADLFVQDEGDSVALTIYGETEAATLVLTEDLAEQLQDALTAWMEAR